MFLFAVLLLAFRAGSRVENVGSSCVTLVLYGSVDRLGAMSKLIITEACVLCFGRGRSFSEMVLELQLIS